jgi:hypothetical protein
MNGANLDEYTVANTVQQLPSKITPIAKREHDLLRELDEINRKI